MMKNLAGTSHRELNIPPHTVSSQSVFTCLEEGLFEARLIKSYGSYTKEESEILLIIAHKTDKVLITRIIKSIDETSFISISKTYGVFGKNFDQLKL